MTIDPTIAAKATEQIVTDLDYIAQLMLTGYQPLPEPEPRPCDSVDPASTVSD